MVYLKAKGMKGTEWEWDQWSVESKASLSPCLVEIGEKGPTPCPVSAGTFAACSHVCFNCWC